MVSVIFTYLVLINIIFRKIKYIFTILLLLNSNFLNAGNEEGNLVKAEIFTTSDIVRLGDEFYIGIRFTVRNGWHIYWLNPGDSGIPTTIEWDVPEGVAVSRIYWPPPHIFEFSGMYNFGYTGTVIIPVKIKIGNTITSPVKITAKVTWLACKEKCIPGNAITSVLINTDSIKRTFNKKNKQHIERALSTMPATSGDWKFSAIKKGNSVAINIETPEWINKELKYIDFIPYAEGIFSTEPGKLTKNSGKLYTLELKLDQYRSVDPKFVEAILNTGINWQKGSENKRLYIKIPVIIN